MYKNKRHAWCKTDSGRAKLSFVSVQVVRYNPFWCVATAFESLEFQMSKPLLAFPSLICYMYFFPSQGSTVSDLGRQCYSTHHCSHQSSQSLNILTFFILVNPKTNSRAWHLFEQNKITWHPLIHSTFFVNISIVYLSHTSPYIISQLCVALFFLIFFFFGNVESPTVPVLF